MLVDEIEVLIKAGDGGPGKVSFKRPPQRGPDGGNGGRGGDVIVRPTTDLMALAQYSHLKKIEASNGERGERNRKYGKNGADKYIYIPVGSTIKDNITGQETEINNQQQFILCKGGLGGRGNFEFRSSTNTTPEYAQPGMPGQQLQAVVVLKLIAEFGLIGLPNAGKSSLLNELTGTSVKTADYPFTTLEPNLGVFEGRVIADIPGLIEGASSGKGLGIKFLKHIEKTSVLLHCIAADSKNPLDDYKTVRDELGEFSQQLLEKPEIILITKSDLVTPLVFEKIVKRFKSLNKQIYSISIYDYNSLEGLKTTLKSFS